MASIKRRPDGRWRARYRAPSGREHAKHFERRVDAERFLTSVEHSKLTGAYVDPAKARTTVADFYRVWSARQPWRASSRSSIGSMFEHHVLPAFGAWQLGSLRRGDVESWAARLPLAGSTAGLAVQYLGTLLEAAVHDGLLASNPVRGAKRPPVEDVPVVPLTVDELDRLRDAAPEWFRVAFTLGALAGLRQGEAAGLTLDRVDFLGRALTVDRQLVTPNAGEPSLGPPKTKRSYRTVPLADVAVEHLAHHVETFGTGADGLLLHEGGASVRRQRFGKVWRGLRRRAGLPAARFHDLRHTYASMLLSGGVSVAAAADYLGHSPAVLLRTYAHLMPADHDRARAVVQAAFDAAADFSRTERASGEAGDALTSANARRGSPRANWAASGATARARCG